MPSGKPLEPDPDYAGGGMVKIPTIFARVIREPTGDLFNAAVPDI